MVSVKPKQEAVESLGTLDQLNLKLSLGRTAHPKKNLEALYFLGINHSKDSSKCWFKASAMGVNSSLMKTMAGKAGFERRLTNHKRAKASDAKTEQ